MPRPPTSHRHDFDHLLDARIAVGSAPQAAAPDEPPPSPLVRQALFGMQESWQARADAPAGDFAQRYETDGRQAASVPAVQGSVMETVAAELGLTRELTVDDLNRVRRDFALANHPDRVAPALGHYATQRMTAANTLIDQALKQKRNQSA